MTDVLEISLTIDEESCQLKASELLSKSSELSQAKIKDAMQKGAVWLTRGKNKQRLRRSSKTLLVGDKVELNYNGEILSQSVPEPLLIHDAKEYSIWFKPFGLNCQGSRWGDFATINRWVEVNLPALLDTSHRPVFLVHRLDRATTGLMLLAHSKSSAQAFSAMFQKGEVDKRYQAIVHGDFSIFPPNHTVDNELDGKRARSVFSHVKCQDGCSLVDVQLLTGRKHQIRQHLSGLGYPIVGDRLYGGKVESEDCDVKGVKDLQLQSVSLAFQCPFTDRHQSFVVPEQLRLKL